MLTTDTPLRVATSCYGAGNLIVPSGLAPVVTSVGLPKFPLDYRIVDRVGMLCPFGLLDIDDEDEFTRLYIERLDRYGPTKILRVLTGIARREQAAGVVLLCFEPVGQFCHRRLLAEWLEEAGAGPVRELG